MFSDMNISVKFSRASKHLLDLGLADVHIWLLKLRNIDRQLAFEKVSFNFIRLHWTGGELCKIRMNLGNNNNFL